MLVCLRRFISGSLDVCLFVSDDSSDWSFIFGHLKGSSIFMIRGC